MFLNVLFKFRCRWSGSSSSRGLRDPGKEMVWQGLVMFLNGLARAGRGGWSPAWAATTGAWTGRCPAGGHFVYCLGVCCYSSCFVLCLVVYISCLFCSPDGHHCLSAWTGRCPASSTFGLGKG